MIGLLHYKDISWEEKEEDLKKYKKNDSVKAKILEIDREKEKIRLGVRQLEKDPFDYFSKDTSKKVGGYNDKSKRSFKKWY